jgi:hypothetical protein
LYGGFNLSLCIRFLFGQHVPDDHSQLTSGCRDSRHSPFLVGNAFEEGTQFMISLVANGISRLSQGYCNVGFAHGRTMTDDAPPTDFIVRYQPLPTGKAFGRGKLMNILT